MNDNDFANGRQTKWLILLLLLPALVATLLGLHFLVGEGAAILQPPPPPAQFETLLAPLEVRPLVVPLSEVQEQPGT